MELPHIGDGGTKTAKKGRMMLMSGYMLGVCGEGKQRMRRI